MMFPEPWNRHHQEDLPHIRYCGKVSLKQMSLKRFFLREQPVGTWIDDIDPWPKVRSDPSVTAQNMDQCMAGAVDGEGLPVMNPLNG